MNEKEILGWLADRSDKSGNSIFIGDDAAYLDELSGVYLTTDTLVEDVHFIKDLFSHFDLAYRAIGTALSDLAAMGTIPRYILVALGAPKTFNVRAFLEEVLEVAKLFQVSLIGGDITNSSNIFVNVTCIGYDGSELKGQKPKKPSELTLRGGLKPNQDIFVTGMCGMSHVGLKIAKKIATMTGNGKRGSSVEIKFNKASRKRGDSASQSLDLRFSKSVKSIRDSVITLSEFERDCLDKYLRPEPKIRQAIIAKKCGATAMTDTSDSLSTSLYDFVSKSKCGIVLEGIPNMSGITETTLLSGGEDYEIVFSIDSDKTDQMLSEFRLNDLLLPIKLGHSDPSIATVFLRGTPLKTRGYEHKFND